MRANMKQLRSQMDQQADQMRSVTTLLQQLVESQQ
jgi:hypothetical protein